LFYLFLGGSNYVTCSVILPAIYNLLKYYDEFNSNSNNDKINTLADSIRYNLKSRLSVYLKITPLYVACYLDPRYRNFYFIYDKTEKANVIKRAHLALIAKSKILQARTPTSTIVNSEPTVVEPPTKKKKLIFSKAWEIISARRNRLSPSTAEMMVLLGSDY